MMPRLGFAELVPNSVQPAFDGAGKATVSFRIRLVNANLMYPIIHTELYA